MILAFGGVTLPAAATMHASLRNNLSEAHIFWNPCWNSYIPPLIPSCSIFHLLDSFALEFLDTYNYCLLGCDSSSSLSRNLGSVPLFLDIGRSSTRASMDNIPELIERLSNDEVSNYNSTYLSRSSR